MKFPTFIYYLLLRLLGAWNLITFNNGEVTGASTWPLSAVLKIVILSACLPVCHFVTRVLCNKKKEHTANMLIPHERLITLVFCHQQRLVGDVYFHLKSAIKVTYPHRKRRLRPIYFITSQPLRASEKSSIIANRTSTTRFPTSYSWSAYVTPKLPGRVLKKRICRFVDTIQVQSNKICYKVSLCKNFQRQSCSKPILLSNVV